MRHFGSLVLALVLTPVIWVAIAFGTNRLARSVLDLSGSAGTDKYLGIGLILVAAVALGVLLVPRLSPLGPAIAGLGLLAVSALGLSSDSPVYDLGRDVLSTADQQTLVSPISTGYLWLAGFLLLVPLVVPARWRKARAAPLAPGPYGPGGATGPGPYGPGPYGQGAGGPRTDPPGGAGSPTLVGPPPGNVGQADLGPGGPGSYGSGGYAPSAYGGYGPAASPPGSGGSPTGLGSPAGADPDDGGYRSDAPAAPGWDSPPLYGERPAQSPGSTRFPSASPYPGSAGAQYPPSTYGSGSPASADPPAYPAQTYPAAYPAPEQTPGPTSYGPTVYGRSRPDDSAEETPPQAPDNDDSQETRRLP